MTTKTGTRRLDPDTYGVFKSRYGTLVEATVVKLARVEGRWELTVKDTENSYLHVISPQQFYTDPHDIATLKARATIPHMHPGTLVQVDFGKRTIAGMKTGDLGVVIADRRPKYRVNVAKLGGFQGAYAQAQATSLTIVDPSRLQELAS